VERLGFLRFGDEIRHCKAWEQQWGTRKNPTGVGQYGLPRWDAAVLRPYGNCAE
jgi:hypothetical protein